MGLIKKVSDSMVEFIGQITMKMAERSTLKDF